MLSNQEACAYMDKLKELTEKCNSEAQKSLELMRDATERDDHDAFLRHNEEAAKSIAAAMAYNNARKLYLEGLNEGGNV